ncbi:DUF2911 domain-containing protein [Pontibacter sp. JH31]|uniref:DUF2911 domain-containing protein n=1 Tax=Pontibacter aquaedesilientis TaxID=2766980 RepID=A0ABR7XDP0_9BACT|nr:DUF2911 domain-containing protein [Pontibacter aquaedesilientis]MBD1396404.1 DUF2911 domain-containing protein [Pontibacter aquaedesilientis]
MKIANYFTYTLLVAFLLMPAISWAQNNNKSNRPSPPAVATGKIGETTVTIDYSSPAVKNRKVWGELVPYGKVWRAGANEATIIEFSKDVTIEGHHLAKGKYSIYTIPGEDHWTVIFNKAVGQWGTEYDERRDALRVQVKPRKSATKQERLTYSVARNGILLRWEHLEIPVKIK